MVVRLLMCSCIVKALGVTSSVGWSAVCMAAASYRTGVLAQLQLVRGGCGFRRTGLGWVADRIYPRSEGKSAYLGTRGCFLRCAGVAAEESEGSFAGPAL